MLKNPRSGIRIRTLLPLSRAITVVSGSVQTPASHLTAWWVAETDTDSNWDNCFFCNRPASLEMSLRTAPWPQRGGVVKQSRATNPSLAPGLPRNPPSLTLWRGPRDDFPGIILKFAEQLLFQNHPMRIGLLPPDLSGTSIDQVISMKEVLRNAHRVCQIFKLPMSGIT